MTPHAEPATERPALDRLLSVVRQLGATSDLGDVLKLIARAVVDVLEFDAVAIQVDDGNDELRIESVLGPLEVERLLGKRISVERWHEVFAACEPWGDLRYLHRTRSRVLEGIAAWVPDVDPPRDPAHWHPEDALFAPMYDRSGVLVGVISVEPPSGQALPSRNHQILLETFAAQASRAIVDTRERQQAAARQRELESRWRLAFESSPVGACLVDNDGFVVDANRSISAMLGCSHDDLVGRHPTDFLYADDGENWYDGPFVRLVAGEIDHFDMECRYRTTLDDARWASLHVGALRGSDEQPAIIIAQIMDITARKQAEAQLAHRASHDPLTDLPNRSTTEAMLADALHLSQPAGVLFCDLDRFKVINDSLGHDAGDELLVSVVLRLREAVPVGFTLARVGGDEFVVIAPGVHDLRKLSGLGEAMRAALLTPFTVRGHSHTVSLSVGVTVSQPWHRHPDEVLREADQAMLRAKRHGRARVEQYDPTLDKHATVAELDLENALRMALAQGRDLRPYFQPIMNLGDDRIVGAEALIRWHHPDRGLMDPIDFLPIAEASGLVIPLGWWMLDVSCRMATRQVADHERMWVAVNVSGRQLGRGQLPSAVRRALDMHALPGNRLHIELTENTLVEASDAAIAELREVADLGVTIALDDFGTGYSSLSLLRDLPVGMVKIDRSFVAPLADSTGTADSTGSEAAIVRRLVALCHELSITTVAEGVETAEQLAILREIGCDLAQGYLIGAPVPAERFGVAAEASSHVS